MKLKEVSMLILKRNTSLNSAISKPSRFRADLVILSRHQVLRKRSLHFSAQHIIFQVEYSD